MSKPPPYIEIDEGEGAAVAKTRAIERHQQLAVFGMGVVVPAEPVIAERHEGEGRHGDEHRDRQPVEERVQVRLAPGERG